MSLGPHAKFLPDLPADPIRPSALMDSNSAATGESYSNASPIDGAAEISYVLGSFQRRELLEVAVESVRRDCQSLRREIIVVDGGSTDGSIEWLCRQKDIVTVVQHNRYVEDGQARRRMSWGRFMNIGFKAASAPWIGMVSDDCIVLPGATSSALRRAAEATAAGLQVGGCAFYFRDYPKEHRYRVQRTLGGNLMVNHGLFCRAALEAIGFANERDYSFYKADTDLALKIWRAGYSIIDSPRSFCEHYVDPEEPARVANNSMLERDHANLRALWPRLIGRKTKTGSIYRDFVDFERHAERLFPSAGVTSDG